MNVKLLPAILFLLCMSLNVWADNSVQPQVATNAAGATTSSVKIKPLEKQIKYPEGLKEDEYSSFIDHYLAETYPSLDRNSMAYKLFLRNLAYRTFHSAGHLWPETFNKQVKYYQHFQDVNDMLTNSVSSSAIREIYAGYYRGSIFGSQKEYDIDKERQLLRSIPQDSRVVNVVKGQSTGAIVSDAYPEFKSLSEEQKKRVYDELCRINPYFIHAGFALNNKRDYRLHGDLSDLGVVKIKQGNDGCEYFYQALERRQIILPLKMP